MQDIPFPYASSSRSIVNEAAAASPVQPIVNMGQGFFGYNPPQFVLNAAKKALDQVDCNQYSPTKVWRPSYFWPYRIRLIEDLGSTTIKKGTGRCVLTLFRSYYRP